MTPSSENREECIVFIFHAQWPPQLLCRESQPANPLAKLASRPKTASKLDLYLTKLYLRPRELSNSVSIVIQVLYDSKGSAICEIHANTNTSPPVR